MLDNIIWSALTTRQARWAVGDAWARRFPAEFAPFLGIGKVSEESVAAMARLARPGEVVHMAGVLPADPPGWVVEDRTSIAQMVFGDGRASEPKSAEVRVETLGATDLPEMLALMAELYPDYFRPRAIELGTYLGIRHEGRLVAMAGERLCLDGYREISGVVTRPEFRGRGYARLLISRLSAEILREGLTPFLHLAADNLTARSTYEKAGFVHRRDLPVLRLRRVDELEQTSP